MDAHHSFSVRLAAFFFQRRRELAVGIFFLTLLVIGLFSFKDYGVPYDEGTLTQLGIESYNYVFEGKAYPADPHFRYHGTAVELPLQMLIKWMGPLSSSTIAFTRRFAVFSFFFACALALYFLGKRFTGNGKLALLGCLFFVLSPRVFAHGFYNSRDIPAMAMFAVSMLTLVRLLDRPTFTRAIVHGLACGFVLGIRLPSIILIPITFLFVGWHALTVESPNRNKTVGRGLLLLIVYALTLVVTTYAVWPLLWPNPIGNFWDAYSFMSHIATSAQFLGKTYTHLPWFYIPAWIGMTTPILYSLLFLIGTIASVVLLTHRRKMFLTRPSVDLLLPLLWFFLPVSLIVLLKSEIYQEWRHVLFLYPAFVLIALQGVRAVAVLIERCRPSLRFCTTDMTMVVLSVFAVVTTGRWMFFNHPFENIYYAVPRLWISDQLEIDYWGLSTKQAVEWIAAHDRRPVVSYYSPQNLALLNGRVFPQPRVIPMKLDEVADYIIELHQPGVPSLYPNAKELYAITVDGMKLTSIYEGTEKGRAFMDWTREDPERIGIALETSQELLGESGFARP